MVALITILMGLIAGNGDFEGQLKKYLDEKLKSYEKYEYQVMRLPATYIRIRIDEEREFSLSKNHAYIPVTVYDKNNEANSSVITVILKLYKTVLIAQKKITVKENLNNSMFEKKLINIGLIEDRLFDDIDAVVKYRCKMLIKEGVVLTKEMVEPIPLVFRGDKLILHSGQGGVDINLDVISRQDGSLGDVISVQANHSLYKGKIVDKYNLILEE
jgi:flagella basal body P-ring formation protein FlgA